MERQLSGSAIGGSWRTRSFQRFGNMARPSKFDPAYIYGLACPSSGGIRYVGKATNPEHRLKQHIRDCRRSDSAKDRWVRSLLGQGKQPDIIILEHADDWQEAERRWIAQLGGTPSLLNVAGGGIPKWTDKTKRAGVWHRQVIARFKELAKTAGPEKAETFHRLADGYRKMRAVVRRCGAESEYEKHLESVFGSALS